MMSEQTTTLSEAPLNTPLMLKNIQGGKQFNRRLVELGLTPGVRLRVLQDSGGPLIIAVRDSRIALGRGMAKKIRVSLSKEDQA
jgi:Fe2+ transport system protein FeoA